MDCVTKVLLTFFFTYITLLSGVGAFQNGKHYNFKKLNIQSFKNCAENYSYFL